MHVACRMLHAAQRAARLESTRRLAAGGGDDAILAAPPRPALKLVAAALPVFVVVRGVLEQSCPRAHAGLHRAVRYHVESCTWEGHTAQKEAVDQGA